MAKKKKNKKQKGADEEDGAPGGATLPAEIAGVKVPKSLRNAGAQLRELAKDPVVSDLIASGLIAAAAALSQTKAGKKATGEAADAASTAAEDAATAGSAVKQTLIGLARNVLDVVETAAKDKKRG